ncbi:hypothetical protein ACU4GD_33680 [Cupriavidus basilensis]
MGYGGPCPPKGLPAHCYIFTVHALGVPKLGCRPTRPTLWCASSSTRTRSPRLP